MMQDHVTINQREISGSADGYAAYLIVSEEADFVKQICIRAEEELTFGMIAYLDVMDRTGLQIGREALGFAPRKCFVCDRQAAFCTSRRLHSDTELPAARSKDDGGLEWGFIGKTGDFAIKPKYEEVAGFSDGMALVKQDEKWGYVDTSGSTVVEPKYANAGPFSEGLAAVQTDDGWGYIDKTGAFVIKPQFDWAYGFSEGLAAVVRISQGGNQHGYIDKSGAFVIQPQYTSAKEFDQGLAYVQSGETTVGTGAYVNRAGEVVWPKVGLLFPAGN